MIAAGAGAFGPNRPPLEGLPAYEAAGAVQYYIRRQGGFPRQAGGDRGRRRLRGGLGAGAEGHRAGRGGASPAEVPGRAGDGRAARCGGGGGRDRDGDPLPAARAARDRGAAHRGGGRDARRRDAPPGGRRAAALLRIGDGSRADRGLGPGARAAPSERSIRRPARPACRASSRSATSRPIPASSS